jgi:hypothetical protein
MYRIIMLSSVGDEQRVTLEREPTRLARFFGAKTKTLEFWGDGTVWHQYPTGRRPGTLMEWLITDLVAWYRMLPPAE